MGRTILTTDITTMAMRHMIHTIITRMTDMVRIIMTIIRTDTMITIALIMITPTTERHMTRIKIIIVHINHRTVRIITSHTTIRALRTIILTIINTIPVGIQHVVVEGALQHPPLK